MDGWLDSNMISASFVQRKRDDLKASTISGNDSIGLTTDKHGLLIASQDGKLVLPKAQITKIKTYEEWYAATDNLCHHFDTTQKIREYTLVYSAATGSQCTFFGSDITRSRATTPTS